MIVCVCRAVSDRQIRSLVDDGAAGSMAELRAACGVGECCGKCARQARELIHERLALRPAQEASRAMNVC
jgi:bacterioferritin-associated ferredoxin